MVISNCQRNLIFFRHKELATYKIDALQKNLAESIPSSTLDEANRQYTELTMKYRDLLQNESTRNAQVFNDFEFNNDFYCGKYYITTVYNC